MGSYLEKNIQTFMEIQNKLQDQGITKMGDNPMVNAEAYSQFVKMQGPAIQGLMSNYLEQSASAFLDMQQQMQKQARNMFGNFAFAGMPSADADEQHDSNTPSAADGNRAKK